MGIYRAALGTGSLAFALLALWLSVVLRSPEWKCSAVPEVTLTGDNKLDNQAITNAMNNRLPFVVRRAQVLPSQDEFLVNTAKQCPELKNMARGDVVPHLEKLVGTTQGHALSAFIKLRKWVVGSGFGSLEETIQRYQRTLGEYTSLITEISPLGSFILDRLIFALAPGILFTIDVAFENEAILKCDYFGSAYANLTASKWRYSKKTHMMLTGPSQHWTLSHYHVKGTNARYTVIPRNHWRYSWQLMGSKRWVFWDEDSVPTLKKNGGFLAFNPTCCFVLAFSIAFGTSGFSRERLTALETLPCWQIDMEPGDVLVFNIAFPHSLYSLSNGTMMSTVSILKDGIAPIVS